MLKYYCIPSNHPFTNDSEISQMHHSYTSMTFKSKTSFASLTDHSTNQTMIWLFWSFGSLKSTYNTFMQTTVACLACCYPRQRRLYSASMQGPQQSIDSLTLPLRSPTFRNFGLSCAFPNVRPPFTGRMDGRFVSWRDHILYVNAVHSCLFTNTDFRGLQAVWCCRDANVSVYA